MSSPEGTRESASEIGGSYANYVLFALVVLYVNNFIDRQIPSILAEELKKDLGLTDAELGFLYGTAFAIFYAIFGIPLGKVADTWDRTKLIAVGLFFWSCMTTASRYTRWTRAGFSRWRTANTFSTGTTTNAPPRRSNEYLPKTPAAMAIG